jgi:predicted HicB family RNase H-like nuclease
MATNNILEYRGYIAELSFDMDDNIIVGRVINTTDTISFHGQCLEEVKQAFHDVLDAYLDACDSENIEPSRPYSGKFNLRIDPQLHKELSTHAALEGKSLNELVTSLLETAIHHNHSPY